MWTRCFVFMLILAKCLLNSVTAQMRTALFFHGSGRKQNVKVFLSLFLNSTSQDRRHSHNKNHIFYHTRPVIWHGVEHGILHENADGATYEGGEEVNVNVITCAVEMSCERCVRMKERETKADRERYYNQNIHILKPFCACQMFSISYLK